MSRQPNEHGIRLAGDRKTSTVSATASEEADLKSNIPILALTGLILTGLGAGAVAQTGRSPETRQEGWRPTWAKKTQLCVRGTIDHRLQPMQHQPDEDRDISSAMAILIWNDLSTGGTNRPIPADSIHVWTADAPQCHPSAQTIFVTFRYTIRDNTTPLKVAYEIIQAKNRLDRTEERNMGEEIQHGFGKTTSIDNIVAAFLASDVRSRAADIADLIKFEEK